MPTFDAIETRREPGTGFAPSTFDVETGTADAILSTGATVDRGWYREALRLEAGKWTLHQPRLPLLDTHNRYSIDGVIGFADQLRFERGQLLGRVTVTDRKARELVRQGLRSLSIGYRARAVEEATGADGRRTITVTEATIHEVSLVPVPAEPGAIIRSGGEMDPVIVTAPAAPAAPPPAVTPPAAPVATRAQINAQIRSVAGLAGLDDAWANGQIDAEASIDQARAAAFTAMGTRAAPPTQTASASVGFSHDDPGVRLERMVEGLACRMTGKKPSDAARPYVGRRLAQFAAELLTLRGERGVGTLSEAGILERAAAHSTSDFPNLLSGAGHRVLMGAYEAAPNPLKALARQTTIGDFRTKTSIRIGGMGRLMPVGENGEIKSTTRSEATETYRLKTLAEIFSITRQALINDDLGAFGDWMAAMGRASAETEAAELVALLALNSGNGPTMSDGNPLFHASHGNLASPATSISDGLDDARKAMRLQKGLSGEPINTAPKYLLVPPSQETSAQMAVALITPSKSEDVNPFSGLFDIMCEARLSGNAWYLFSDPAVLPVLEFAYLSSAPGPQISSREGWGVLGTEFRVYLDFGCGAVDWRGAYRNPVA